MNEKQKTQLLELWKFINSHNITNLIKNFGIYLCSDAQKIAYFNINYDEIEITFEYIDIESNDSWFKSIKLYIDDIVKRIFISLAKEKICSERQVYCFLNKL